MARFLQVVVDEGDRGDKEEKVDNIFTPCSLSPFSTYILGVDISL
jgi:hypothetical protein